MSEYAGKRLTVDMIRADIKKTGIKIISDHWFSFNGCGCPMAIHAVADDGFMDVRNERLAKNHCCRKFGADYVEAFTDAFDCPNEPLAMLENDPDSDACICGHGDGTAARMEFLPIESEVVR